VLRTGVVIAERNLANGKKQPDGGGSTQWILRWNRTATEGL